MRKLLSPLFGLAFSISLLVLMGQSVPVLAQPRVDIEDSTWQPYRLPGESTTLDITSSSVYTIYLPIIYVPPPPNPKKGMGVVASPACDDLKTLDASWYLNWGLNPDATCNSSDDKNFVPRISSAAGMPLLSQAIANAQASGWLIGFSEPNLPWQGNLTPAEGAILWKQIEDAADPAGIKLVSPSPNQWEPGQNGLPYGHQWTWAMVDEYKNMYGKNPRFDALGWNIYTSNPDETKTFLIARRNEALAKGYNVPIWVLEYGGECWNGAGNQSIMTSITAWFDATPWIGRYAWFANRLSGSNPNAIGWQSCSLINPNNGTLTSLGQLYRTY